MFRSGDLLAKLRKNPFRPIRIVASQGLRYDINHPDLVLVGNHDVTIGHADPAKPGVYDQLTQVALVHVVALEKLPLASPGNGQT
jgi:hypothetical protein